MITLLLFPTDGPELVVELESLMPHLDSDDRILVDANSRDSTSAQALNAVTETLGEHRCSIVQNHNLLPMMVGEYLLPLAPGMRLRNGALADVKAFLRRSVKAPCVRFPAPNSPDPEDPFQGRRRRLFGVPMRLALSKPYLLHRDTLGRLSSATLLAALRKDDFSVWLELELSDASGPGSGAWAPIPLVDSDVVPHDPIDAETQQSALQQYVSRSGRPVTLELSENGLGVRARRARGIDIELTTRCNARCIFCPQRDLSNKQNMTDEVFQRVLTMIREQNLGTIYFIGRGEPLMHPRFIDYVREIRNWTGIEFEVFTNGLALTPTMIDRLARLNDSELNISINVSLHSLQEDTHRRLTGTDLRTISENLRYLQRHRGALRVSYAFVKNKINEHEMAVLRRHLDRTGNRDWDISLVYNKGGHVAPGELFDPDFYRRHLTDDQRELPATGPCWYSYCGQYYWVNVHGQFTLCHDDFEEETILGDVGVDSLEVIDARVAELRRSGGAARCRRCNKRQRELHHDGYGEEAAQVKDRFLISTEACS